MLQGILPSTGKNIRMTYNSLGQLETYEDGSGNTATYHYAVAPEGDGLLEELTDSSAGKTTRQTYAYDAVTKAETKMFDSAAGTFTASYGPAGELASEVYPNGMCANYTYNSVGEATNLEYIKTTNCTESKPTVWFSESRAVSARGETLSRKNTLSEDFYTYDTEQRLTETQEFPTGEGCTSRIYAYNEESDRTKLTTRAPGVKGECATTGGTIEEHAYDEGGRLADTGIAYDELGNIRTLPAADAGGNELSSTFYVDNAVATQTQNGVTNEYVLDAEGRVSEAKTGGKTTINHYDGSGNSVAWACPESAGKCEESKETREIAGIDGSLTAVQTNGEVPVLQLHDLQGDVVATASLSSEATKLMSSYNVSEFGVPNAGKTPPKYAWQGATGAASELSSGVITDGSTSYVPQTGRELQSEAIEPPGLPEGSGAGAAYVSQEEPWNMQGAEREGREAPGLEAAREREAAEAACQANPAACAPEGAEEIGGGSGGGGGLGGLSDEEVGGTRLPSLAAHGCNASANIKSGAIGTLIAIGGVYCEHHQFKLEIQVCMKQMGIHGGSIVVDCSKHLVKSDAKEMSSSWPHGCAQDASYFAWVKATVYSPYYWEGFAGPVKAADGAARSSASTPTMCISGALPPGAPGPDPPAVE